MTRILTLVLGALLVFALVPGCGGDEPGTKMDKMEGDGIAGLSEADQKLARAQKTCPISGAPLGSMGTPVKETYKGRTVFFCCESCRKPFLKDPEKYIAKLR